MNIYMSKTLNDRAMEIHQFVNACNWRNKNNLECLALIASEVGEAVNECRGHYPTSNFKFELIDVLLRTLDLCQQNEIDVDAVFDLKMEMNNAKLESGELTKSKIK